MSYDLKDKKERKACSTGTPNAKGLRLGRAPTGETEPVGTRTRPAPGGDPLTQPRAAGLHVSFASFRFFRLSVQNKANSRHGIRTGKGLAGKELW